jgi:hypothetical protein
MRITGGLGLKDIVTGTAVVIATNLVAVSVFEAVRKHLQEVEDFDCCFV